MMKRFIFLSLLAAVVMYWGAAYAAGLKSWAPGLTDKTETLSFYNTHTHQNFEITVRNDGKPVRRGYLQEVSYFLRDHRTDDVHNISPDLLALLADIKRDIKAKAPGKDVVFHVISGYRSPKTNEMLRSNGGGQAKKSRHMHGDAMDIRVPGFDTVMLRNIAWCQQEGGVGYYRGSDFVHVDTDRVRFWNWSPANLDCGKVLTN